MNLRPRIRIALCTLMVAAAAVLPGTAAVAAPAARAQAGEDCDATQIPAPAGQPVSGSIPVLFVHGLDSSPGIWDQGPGAPITAQVAALPGVTAWTYDYSKVAVQWVTNPQIGLGLAGAITCLAQATGKQAIVVAHSMGGLATQYAVSQTGTDGVLVASHVAKVITIGTPAQGSLSGAILVDGAAGAEAAISLLGPAGKTLVAGIDAARSACAGAVIKDPQADPCSWFGLDETPAGRALLYGSPELAALPPWPSGLPVVAMAGSMSESVGVGGFTIDVSLGDVIVSLGSATAYDTSGAPVVVTCPNASLLGIFLDSDDELCYHHNLPRNPQIEAAVLKQIRASAPAASPSPAPAPAGMLASSYSVTWTDDTTSPPTVSTGSFTDMVVTVTGALCAEGPECISGDVAGMPGIGGTINGMTGSYNGAPDADMTISGTSQNYPYNNTCLEGSVNQSTGQITGTYQDECGSLAYGTFVATPAVASAATGVSPVRGGNLGLPPSPSGTPAMDGGTQQYYSNGFNLVIQTLGPPAGGSVTVQAACTETANASSGAGQAGSDPLDTGPTAADQAAWISGCVAADQGAEPAATGPPAPAVTASP